MIGMPLATVVNKKALFVTLVDCVPRLEGYRSQFFDKFVSFVVLIILQVLLYPF